MRKQSDVIVVIDGYGFFQPAIPARGANIFLEAAGLTGLARSHSNAPLVFTILNEHDHLRQVEYSRLGHIVRCMNGDRPTALPNTVKELVAVIEEKKPRKLIIVGHDEALSALCAAGSRVHAEVLVWNTGTSLPAALLPFSAWRLTDLLPNLEKQSIRAAGWLDAENLLISLKKQGLPSDPKTFFRALKTAVESLDGSTQVAWQAWADWSSLREPEGVDYQRVFEEQGAKTHYQIALPGKSTSDMAIVGAIHETLQREDGQDLYIIGTGDGDFLPTVDAIHARGKKVVVIAIRGCLNSKLASSADQVIYLNDYLQGYQKPASSQPSATNNPSTEALTALLATVYQMDQNRWRYVYPSKVPNIISADWVESAVQEDLLSWQVVSGQAVLILNLNNPWTQAARIFQRWLLDLLDYCFHKPNPFPYVDTAFLLRKAQETSYMRDLPFTQQRALFTEWLDASTTAGLLQKEEIPHPKTPERIITTWRPTA